MASGSFRGNEKDQLGDADHPEDTPASSSGTRPQLRRSARAKGKEGEMPPPACVGSTSAPSARRVGSMPSTSTSRLPRKKGKEREMPPSAPMPSGSTVAPSARNTGSMASTSTSLLRPRPIIRVDPQGPPVDPEFIALRHPANNLVLFRVYAYDRLPGPELKFGIHHDTMVSACQIVANNEPGYLSQYREPDGGRVDIALDSILPPGVYYYHLDNHTEKLYPVCPNFRSWTFPHNKMPPSWPKSHLTASGKCPSSWTALSQNIKDRDNICLVSGSTEYLSTAHVVPRDEEEWLQNNNMDFYLGNAIGPYNQSPHNLFALRYDFHRAGFDRGQFVIVPKSGELVVHFLGLSSEFANVYHNVIFDDKGYLSHEALYARFAWAVLKHVAGMKLNPKQFKLVNTQNPDAEEEGGEGGSDTQRMRKRKRKDEDKGEKEEVKDTDENNHASGSILPGGQSRRRQLDALLQGPNAWLSDVLLKIAPDNGQSSLEDDTHEIEEDLRLARRYQPFLVDPKIESTAYNYENIRWYPGMGVVERRKQRYLDSHPNIKAHSDSLQSNSAMYDSD